MNHKIARIYGLCDPIDGNVRYVGKTVQRLEQRLTQHMQKAKRKQHPRALWIQDLAARGLRPEIKLLETVPYSEWKKAEAAWVSKFYGLLNAKATGAGGDGPKMKLPLSQDLIDRMGKESDAALAVEYEVNRKTISYHRNKMGIARFTEQRVVIPPMGGWNKIELPEWVIEKLGTMPDKKLADEAGVSKKRIMVERQKLCIEAWGNKNGNPTQFKKGQPHPRWNKERG